MGEESDKDLSVRQKQYIFDSMLLYPRCNWDVVVDFDFHNCFCLTLNLYFDIFAKIGTVFQIQIYVVCSTTARKAFLRGTLYSVLMHSSLIALQLRKKQSIDELTYVSWG